MNKNESFANACINCETGILWKIHSNHWKYWIFNIEIFTSLLPGGRLEILENSEEGILREIKEEVGLNLDYKLVSIEENIVKDTKFHMIEFVFYTEIDNFEMLTNLDDGWDKFEIVEIKDIDNYDIRPKSVKNLIKENSYNDIYHNVNYDWGE